MKKIILIIICILAFSGVMNAQESKAKVKVYCEVTCVEYNLFKKDVNAIVDFGIADSAKNAKGWIYNSDTDKKHSFSSPMNVFKYMAERGWEYKDAIVEKNSSVLTWHFILMKEMPVGYNDSDIVEGIDYRIQ